MTYSGLYILTRTLEFTESKKLKKKKNPKQDRIVTDDSRLWLQSPNRSKNREFELINKEVWRKRIQ